MQAGNGLAYWGNTIMIILSGRLGATATATLAIFNTVKEIQFGLSFGAGLALQVRVGHHLGRGDPSVARLSATMAVVLILLLLHVGCWC